MCAAQGCVGLKLTCPHFLILSVRMRAVWGITSVLGENKNIFQSHPFKSKTTENLSDTRDETACFGKLKQSPLLSKGLLKRKLEFFLVHKNIS